MVVADVEVGTHDRPLNEDQTALTENCATFFLAPESRVDDLTTVDIDSS